MEKLKGYVVLFVLIALASTGLINKLIDIFNWLVYLNLNQPDVSIFGDVVVRVFTFLISFFVVGVVFNCLNWFRAAPMKIAYFVVSTIVSFGLSWVVMQIEQNAIIILSVIMALIVIVIITKIIKRIIKKKKQRL